MRTTLITTLCVLTFLWNAFKVYNSISAFNKAEVFAQVMPKAMEEMQDQLSNNKDLSEKDLAEAEKMFESLPTIFSASNVKNSAIVNLLSAILLILGGVWMWDMRKKGYWTYIAGSALGVFGPIIFFGGTVGGAIGLISLIMAGLFVGLYSIEFKKFV